jgi:hypothetical protein
MTAVGRRNDSVTLVLQCRRQHFDDTELIVDD